MHEDVSFSMPAMPMIMCLQFLLRSFRQTVPVVINHAEANGGNAQSEATRIEAIRVLACFSFSFLVNGVIWVDTDCMYS